MFKKRIRGDSYRCAGSLLGQRAQLPELTVYVRGCRRTALVDTGCSRTIISKAVAGESGILCVNDVTMMNGDVVSCFKTLICTVSIAGKTIELNCLVSEIIPGYDVLLGMDAITAMGGVTVTERSVNFPVFVSASTDKSPEITITDKDFEAKFSDGEWTASWKWTEESVAPALRNYVSHYAMKPDVELAFNDEVDAWITKGWLKETSKPSGGVIPLMAVVQVNKDKVRPVFDFRELNNFVSSHTGQSVVCGEKIRKWRRLGTALSIVDLKHAYLQIRINEELWKYQVVRYKEKFYALTRLGFGLNVAPKIMNAIVNKVLSLDPEVRQATDSYIDDIIVNEEIVSSEQVMNLLKKFGLDCKPPEKLCGSRVLGLQVFSSTGNLWWKRDNVLQPPSEVLTKRDVFSFCGRLIGHFPVANWLRPACSYLKRLTNDCEWDSVVSESVLRRVNEVWDRVVESDPVKGLWFVPSCESGRVYCDASSLATGVCLQIGDHVVEDNSWLRKTGDSMHINLAELEAVVKGVNLAVKWNVKELEVVTDSNSVFNWLKATIDDDHRAKVSGLSEILVRRRLSLLIDIANECDVQLTPVLVRSSENIADQLTRVPKR